METSKLFSLDWRDLGKGLVVAIGGAAITAIQTGFSAGGINWHSVINVAIAAGLAYVGKQFFTAGAVVTPLEK